MKKIMFLLAALVAYAMPSTVSALDVEGFYVGALGAANFLETNNNHRHRNRKFDVGYAVGGMIGYRWCEGWRLEGEVSYRDNERRRRHSSSGVAGVSGRRNHRHHFRSWSYMANGYYDFSQFSCYCFDLTPYVGVGVGYTAEQFRDRRRGGTDSSSRSNHHHKHGFAWQVIAGLAYPICDCGEVTIEYRFHEGRQRRLYNHDVGATLKWFF